MSDDMLVNMLSKIINNIYMYVKMGVESKQDTCQCELVSFLDKNHHLRLLVLPVKYPN